MCSYFGQKNKGNAGTFGMVSTKAVFRCRLNVYVTYPLLGALVQQPTTGLLRNGHTKHRPKMCVCAFSF